jgi:excisionase family DNA binding protein
MAAYTVKEAAALLGLSEASVYVLCRRGELKHRREGPGRGKILIARAAIDRYLRRTKVTTPKPG